MELSGCRVRRLLSRHDQSDGPTTTGRLTSLHSYERSDSVLESESDYDGSFTSDDELDTATGSVTY